MTNNGGPAFPHEHVSERFQGHPSEWTSYKGMSLRDYFATHVNEEELMSILWEFINEKPDTWQQARYIHADRMLAAREVKP